MTTATATAMDWIGIADELAEAFAEHVAERDDTDTFPRNHYAAFKERGLITALVPTELGGGGMSHSTMCELLRVLARSDASSALALSMHEHLVAAQVFNHLNGRPAPVLPRVAANNLVLVSTGARDWLESNGSMRQVPDGFRVTARKAFASGSPAGDLLVTSAPLNDPAEGWQVLHFAVPLNAEGVSLGDDWKVHGMRATGSQTVALEDVFVPEAAISLRRPRGAYHDVFNVIAAVALPIIGGVYLGIAEHASTIATGLARANATSAEVQWALGEARSQATIARVCWQRMVALANDFAFTPSLELTDEMLILKTQLVESARMTVERAMEASGGKGFFRRSGLELLLRDVRAGHYHPLPQKEQLRFTGRLALGLDPVAPRE